VVREPGGPEDVLEELPVVDEKLRPALDELLQPLALGRQVADEAVQDGERRRGDEAADKRVVTIVHRVLHGVRGRRTRRNARFFA
jgi:hypothetical protein